MIRQITFRKSEKEDLPRISEFRKAFFSYTSVRSHEPEYYEWKCYQNPVLPGEMWLAEDGQELVGIKNITPKRMKFQEATIIGAELGDSFTRPDYQRQGIFTATTKAARDSLIERGVSLIYTTPSPTSESLHGYLKYLDHEVVPIKLRRMIKPVHSKHLLKAKFHFALVAAILSPVVRLASRAMLKLGTRGTRGSDIQVSREETVPPDIDALWEQASSNYDVILDRHRDYLHWRYIANPDTYPILVARNGEGVLLGYMVTKIASFEDVQTGFIVDFLTVRDNPDVFKRLLASALEEHFQKRLDNTQTWAIEGSAYYRILSGSGFIPHNRILLACYKNEMGAKVLNGNLRWHFTMGDADVI